MKKTVIELNNEELIEQCEWWNSHLTDTVTLVPNHYDYQKTDLFSELLSRFKIAAIIESEAVISNKSVFHDIGWSDRVNQVERNITDMDHGISLLKFERSRELDPFNVIELDQLKDAYREGWEEANEAIST